MTIKQEQNKSAAAKLSARIECHDEQKDWMTGVKYARQISQSTDTQTHTRALAMESNANATNIHTRFDCQHVCFPLVYYIQ